MDYLTCLYNFLLTTKLHNYKQVVKEARADKQSRMALGAFFPPEGTDYPMWLESTKKYFSKYKYWVGAWEVAPTTGRIHWQWAALNDTPLSLSTHRSRMMGFGLTIGRGTFKQACEYVIKSESKPTKAWLEMHKLESYVSTNVEGLQEPEEPAAAPILLPARWVKHEDLLPWQKSMDGILEGLYAAQNDRKCVVIVDEEGGKGKSMLARYMAQNPCHAVVQGGKRDNIAYVLYQMMNPDPIPGLKRDQQPIGKEPKRLIIDIARQEGSTQDIIAYSAAEQVLNGHFFSQKYKCGSGLLTKEFCQVLIMTNYEPDFKQLSSDRWLVYTVKPETMELQLRENTYQVFGSFTHKTVEVDPEEHVKAILEATKESAVTQFLKKRKLD